MNIIFIIILFRIRSKIVKVRGDKVARLADIIESFIKDLFDETDNGILEIQRNELANRFGCAPSQINYVLMTRFNIDKGYYIESKRGGGGSIRITKIIFDRNEYLNDLIFEKMGSSITQGAAESYIDAFFENNFITQREAAMMKAAVNDKAISAGQGDRDSIRANILKSMLVVLLQ